jgi:hypothetical protein
MNDRAKGHWEAQNLACMHLNFTRVSHNAIFQTRLPFC